MRRHILRLTFLAILFAFATSAHAQATGADCSTAIQPVKTWNQQPPDAPGTGPACNGSYHQSFTVYSTTVDSCVNNNNGVTYAGGAVRQTTGTGYWSAPTSGAPFCSNSTTLKCNPNITQQVTHATSATDYNRFYLRAWDDDGAFTPPCTTVPVMSRQDFWQCQGIACTGTGGGGGGGGCICPDGCPPCTVKFLSPDKKGHLILASPTDCCHATSPILIDVSGKGFVLTDAANGVAFDIMGTGRPIQMGWTAKGVNNAFLALPGADGLVHGGKELFGNYTPQPRSSNPNGFAALAVYDDPKNGGNGNGEIDPGDAIYSSLRLWIDANHDGICQAEEMYTLSSLGVSTISLNYKSSQRADQYGNVFQYRALVDQGDSAHVGRTAYDVYFVSIQPAGASDTLQAGVRKCQAPNPYYLPATPALVDKR